MELELFVRMYESGNLVCGNEEVNFQKKGGEENEKQQREKREKEIVNNYMTYHLYEVFMMKFFMIENMKFDDEQPVI